MFFLLVNVKFGECGIEDDEVKGLSLCCGSRCFWWLLIVMVKGVLKVWYIR